VWIGPHVSIVGPVKIGDNAKIGAGTVVIKDVPKDATSVGNPNRVIIK
jgi:serine O-acetyltransferase